MAIESRFVEIDISSVHAENPFSRLVSDQHVVEVPHLTLESGLVLQNFPVAYKSWGTLNAARDNVLVVCHALTGSSDVADWWGPLLGPGLAFDVSRFFVICLNSLGSPYGSFSPLSFNEATGRRYGPEFPLTTVRDDVRAHRKVLDSLGVNSLACVVGGSMGGMLAMEWAASFDQKYVRNVVALATSARHSAWCISWSEAQRQSIYSDPKYLDGYYSLQDPPSQGLAAARMSALLTYRTRNGFENKFARKSPSLAQHQKTGSIRGSISGPIQGNTSISEQSLKIHNDGHISRKGSTTDSISFLRRASHGSNTSSSDSIQSAALSTSVSSMDGDLHEVKPAQTYFSAQSYLRYQGTKFVNRFDANCYIAITRKLDTHDLARDREEFDCDMVNVLQSIKQPLLVIGIESDGLFTYSEQEYIAEHTPNSRIEKITSPEGHDAFLLEFKSINKLIVDFMREHEPAIMSSKPVQWEGAIGNDESHASMFGEQEEVTNW